MNPKRRRLAIILLLIISIINYTRIPGIESIRNIQFISIFTIGALSGLLLREIAQLIKNKWLV